MSPARRRSGQFRRQVLAALACLGAITLLAESTAPADDGAKRPAAFSVVRHGFAFTNAFTGWPWPIDQARDHPSEGGNAYGLCGGMSLAAADYFLADAQTPDLRRPPGPGSSWHAYLWVRQARSLGFMGYRGLRFMQWMALPDAGEDGTRARTRRALTGARERLDTSGVLPLGLVYRSWREGAVPWQNHQVLGYAWSEPGEGRIEIRIYDPNFPGREDVLLRLSPTVEAAGDDGPDHDEPTLGYQTELIVPGRRARPVRGVFVMGHVPRPVPR